MVGVSDLLQNHYQTYGRNFFSRYDYEEVDSVGAQQMIDHLNSLLQGKALIGTGWNGFIVAAADDFSYEDPIDKSVSNHQGIRIIFTDTSRIVFRLSGTGSQGATIRMYVEKYVSDVSQYTLDAQVVLKPLIDIALEISKLRQFTGRSEPTVIT
jgi:phosphoglucomutase